MTDEERQRIFDEAYARLAQLDAEDPIKDVREATRWPPLEDRVERWKREAEAAEARRESA